MKVNPKPKIPNVPNQHWPQTGSILDLNPWEMHSCIGPRKLMYANNHQQANKGKAE